MHEMGIALEIFRHCEEQMVIHGGIRIEVVRVAIGELSAVEPDLLKYAWQAVVADGPHELAEMEVDWHPCRQVCGECDKEIDRAEGSWLRLCPTCGNALEVSGGKELDIVELTVETEDE
ncbi:MAG: hydrogenase maturation nickel metallochaperone HypA [bacterium]|nr:hydrogenase maturation nickel metallochaperone HypA [bacterium]